jgi:hypothetical protein
MPCVSNQAIISSRPDRADQDDLSMAAAETAHRLVYLFSTRFGAKTQIIGMQQQAEC